LLAAGRKAEIDGLVSGSGMTKAQIQAEQFKIEQEIFALEQDSKKAKEAILEIEDRIYDITELREAKLLDIRDIEQTIDGLRNNQLRDAEKHLGNLEDELAANQAILDAQIAKIDLQKLKWESIQISLDAYRKKLKSITDGELKTMADLVAAIANAMATISSTSFNPKSGFVTKVTAPTSATDAATAATAAAAAADAAAEATDAANAEADANAIIAEAAQAAAAQAVADEKAARDKAFADALAAIAAAAKAGDEAAKAYIEAQKDEAERLAAIAKQKAQRAAQAAAMQAAADAAAGKAVIPKPVSSGGGTEYILASSGGMVPKYLASGGRLMKPFGSDTVPAMLTPGEFVMNKSATKAFGPMLAAMNGLKYPSMLGSRGNVSNGRNGGMISSNLVAQSYSSPISSNLVAQSYSSPISTNFVTQSYPQMSNVSVTPITNMSSANVNTNSTAVYNYSVGINVNGSNSSPNDIARAVMTEIKNVDAQRIRSQRA
jgi:primosomal protein N''